MLARELIHFPDGEIKQSLERKKLENNLISPSRRKPFFMLKQLRKQISPPNRMKIVFRRCSWIKENPRFAMNLMSINLRPKAKVLGFAKGEGNQKERNCNGKRMEWRMKGVLGSELSNARLLNWNYIDEKEDFEIILYPIKFLPTGTVFAS